MPRPETITPEDTARWDRGWEEFDFAGAGLPAAVKELPGIREKIWYPGEWVKEQLEALECSPQTCGEICFALGQRAFVARDPWIGAVEAVDDYQSGIVNTNVPTMLVIRQEEKESGVTLEYISDGNRQQDYRKD